MIEPNLWNQLGIILSVQTLRENRSELCFTERRLGNIYFMDDSFVG
jgi:hypothetical protein